MKIFDCVPESEEKPSDQTTSQATPVKALEKRVSFGEIETLSSREESAVRNFYMMDSTAEEKPNFMVGGEEVEDKDEFPNEVSPTNGGLVKQNSDAMLLNKRRRLR
jgi:hypothetical protein